jgi:hypothetical protein
MLYHFVRRRTFPVQRPTRPSTPPLDRPEPLTSPLHRRILSPQWAVKPIAMRMPFPVRPRA